jgi:hypothetical protein
MEFAQSINVHHHHSSLQKSQDLGPYRLYKMKKGPLLSAGIRRD